MTSRWQIFLDPDTGDDAREAAWLGVRERIRQPVLFQLRRRIDGWRLTEDLADEVCERVHDQYAGQDGTTGLRAGVAGVLRIFFVERNLPADPDELFLRDWASSLLFAALREHRRASPASHTLLMRQYDRPEGARPLTAAEMAAKLDHPLDEVEGLLSEGRDEVRELFEGEIRHTVVADSDAEAELAQLMPHTRALFTT